ncbi:hypothetical protein IEU95_08090 [Hoyosella rhizosphaerae]|uniref:Uncharacterized protein n=1 Tax=Hoyosella rhizosphaerae TaxID=1755582 RepID=A0A916X9A7_9ACTN|nr:hypothetical protein [Hoyosella rhizosphaerae]MBN4926787.1 hypothetical protein [Hoyosella rhizosphaerae]GGC56449.1 hypothetical protein GCM10011410_06180 [Hoyosella rhizosphaerae]
MLDRAWVPMTVASLQLLGLVRILFSVASVAGPETRINFAIASGESTTTAYYTAGAAAEGALVAGQSSLPIWLMAAVLIAGSGLWSRSQKLIWLGLLPAACIVLGVLPELGWILLGESGFYAGSLISVILVLVAVPVVVWRLWPISRAHA